uniref:Uncharacterized protein n=1 Tax=Meloidogyne enterolobii TaxID=390850 RepID=A0A6V7WFU4_MELEN|nr:unnamed protein product [Meloidogyne enterolobii]
MEQEELNMRTQLNMRNIFGEKEEWKMEALGDVDAKEMEFRRISAYVKIDGWKKIRLESISEESRETVENVFGKINRNMTVTIHVLTIDDIMIEMGKKQHNERFIDWRFVQDFDDFAPMPIVKIEKKWTIQ